MRHNQEQLFNKIDKHDFDIEYPVHREDGIFSLTSAVGKSIFYFLEC